MSGTPKTTAALEAERVSGAITEVLVKLYPAPNFRERAAMLDGVSMVQSALATVTHEMIVEATIKAEAIKSRVEV